MSEVRPTRRAFLLGTAASAEAASLPAIPAPAPVNPGVHIGHLWMGDTVLSVDISSHMASRIWGVWTYWEDGVAKLKLVPEGEIYNGLPALEKAD